MLPLQQQGDAIDFGDLTQIRRGITGHSNSIRGIFAGGELILDQTQQMLLIT